MNRRTWLFNVLGLLEAQRDYGLEEVPRRLLQYLSVEPAPKPAPAPGPPAGSPRSISVQPPSPKPAPKPLPGKEKPVPLPAPDLATLHAALEGCTRCSLHQGRTNLVFGVGNPQPTLMFVGEGPGADEDAQGEPFVGRAGQLLTKMIGAMGLQRGDVYIANIVKCRPPGNREPLPEEAYTCIPFLKEQIRLLQPKYICTLGRVATQYLLQTQKPMGQLRGKWQMFEGVRVMPTYHPAFLLRSPSKKRDTWEDLQHIMKEMALPPPAGGWTV